MEKEPNNHPFSLSLSKADRRMVRQAHHERNEDILRVTLLMQGSIG
jgi:hypothetical protein